MVRIVVIEDSADVRGEVVDILRFEGFEVFEAENGRLGVQAVERVVPDLVLCDLMMPELDGYGVLERIRASPTLATLPFLFLTARADRVGMRAGMERGADDYLTKPFTATELLAAIDAALARRNRQRGETEARLDTLREQVATSLPHELRTPLNIIMGYAELLRDCTGGFETAIVPDVAQQILDAGTRLHRLTENFLLYAQLEILGRESSSRRRLEASALRLDEVAGAMAASMASRAGRGADLEVTLPACHVAIEEGSLRKVVEELVDNALKFSQPSQRVVVSGTIDGDEVVMVVADHGRGLSPEALASIGGYQQFERDRWEQQGAGLGLAIAQRIVAVWGGSCVIASDPAMGTRVTVRLPVAPTTGASPTDERRADQ